MRSLSLLLLLAAALSAAARPASADVGPSHVLVADSVVPEAAEQQIRQAIATRWRVAPERVVIEWSPAPRGTRVPEGADTELLGAGLDGWWVAAFTGAGTSARVRLRAGVRTPADVAARPLTRGHHLLESDIERAETVVWGAPGAPVTAQPGWTVRRAMAAGEVLVPPAVEPPVLIRSGEAVELSIERGSIAITVEGVALGTAREGERIRVRASTGRLVHGIAVAPGRVRAGRP